ncbi:hypothetical protein KR074_008521 [Drosophila pseudoananassae]|nr:hypothetical protein KR074_008521 [Drosophila pseudoananassae]
MIFPVALISAIVLFPAALASEEPCYLSEDKCETINVQRNLEKCQKDLLKCGSDLHIEGLVKYAQISKGQQDYSDVVKSNLEVQNKHTEVLIKLKDTEVKYAQLQSKQQEAGNIINQKNMEIDFLRDHIRDLKEKCALATLTNHFREDIAKLEEIVKIRGVDLRTSNNTAKNVAVKTAEVPTTPLPNPTTPQTKTIFDDYEDYLY